MASLPSLISIEVRPYDEEQERLLARLPEWARIEHAIASGLKIPREQFLVYTLFRHLDTQSLSDLRQLVGSQERLLGTSVVTTADSFTAQPRLTAAEHRPEAQVIGEALGLCFMDEIYGTTEADWQRIPEGRAKSLDYMASNSKRLLEVESKGSFVEDRTAKTSSISHHKTDILKKKAAPPLASHNRDVRIGTICAIDRQTTGSPRIWLVDPPVAYAERTPEQIRVLHRLRFILRWILLIHPSSSVAAALRMRIVDLEHLSDFSPLDGVPLSSGSEETLFAREGDDIHSKFFATRSVIADGPAGGVIIPSGEDELFFCGIRQSLLDLAISQDFSAVRRYAEVPATLEKRVVAVISRGRFRQYGFDERSEHVKERGRGYLEVKLRGPIHYSAGGLVFGWLPRPETL